MKYDVAVIGGGVVGGFIARELTRYGLETVILEAGADVASGASRANSGIVHAGFDAPLGSLKAKFNLRGNLMMAKVCNELGVKYKRIGSLVTSPEEKLLEDLLMRGKQNGVKGLSIIARERLIKAEPHIADNVRSALYAPMGGIVCPYGLTIAAIGNAIDNGARLLTDFKVVKYEKGRLFSANGNCVEAKYFVNAAGAGCEKVAELFGDRSFKIYARKGEYILLDQSAGEFVSHTMFALPTKAGKGVLVTPTVDGNLLIGPTSVEENDFDKSVRREAFEEIKKKAGEICKDIPYGETITSFAGVRAYCDRHDFIIEESAVGNLFNVAGIESPGLTAAPAIGEYVAKFIADKFGAEISATFDPHRRPSDWFARLSQEEKNAVIKEKPEYGRIICRCEGVSLGEIIDAMRTEPKARTIDGIKYRTRAGMGRCQSGFCQPHVLDALMAEYGLAFDEITKNGGKSQIIAGGEK